MTLCPIIAERSPDIELVRGRKGARERYKDFFSMFGFRALVAELTHLFKDCKSRKSK